MFTLVPASGAVADDVIGSINVGGATSHLQLQDGFGVCATVDIGRLTGFTVVFTVQGQTSTADTTVGINHRIVSSGFGTWSDCSPGGLSEALLANVVATVTATSADGSSITNTRMECQHVAIPPPRPPVCIALPAQ